MEYECGLVETGLDGMSAEFAAMVAICTHAEPKGVIFDGSEAEKLANEAKKFAVERIDVEADIAFFDCDEQLLERLQSCAAKLKPDAVVVICVGKRRSSDALKAALEAAGKHFKIVMPFFANHFFDGSYCFVFASNKYHPTADINLQRADLTDGLGYYNSDIHRAAFVLPQFLKSELGSYLKN